MISYVMSYWNKEQYVTYHLFQRNKTVIRTSQLIFSTEILAQKVLIHRVYSDDTLQFASQELGMLFGIFKKQQGIVCKNELVKSLYPYCSSSLRNLYHVSYNISTNYIMWLQKRTIKLDFVIADQVYGNRIVYNNKVFTVNDRCFSLVAIFCGTLVIMINSYLAETTTMKMYH